MEVLTQEDLKENLNYNPNTGIFTRKKNNVVAGWVEDTGYIRIRINNQKYYAHRLAVLYMTGSFPISDTDHINMIKGDNRWCNLRCCSRAQNRMNTKKRENCSSKYKGVCFVKGSNKWLSSIRINGSDISLGLHDNEKDAAIAYDKKASDAFGEFSRINFN